MYNIIKSSILSFIIIQLTLGQSDSTWETIFNGQDLTGWTPVFQGYAVGENPGNIFRVENGEMIVTYEGLNNDVGSAQLGNIWYEKEYSYYLLSLEYQIWGSMAANSVGWGRENSGIMLHTQSAQSMAKDQNFPLSLEMQIVGPNTSGIGGNPKKTGNLCTLGNDVIFTGQNNYTGAHCTASAINAVPLDTWVKAGALVLGDSLIQHIINDEVAIEYGKPIIVNDAISGDTAALLDDINSPLTKGYIALQSEGHPFKFRNIRVLNLKGCMDPQAPNYKDYFVVDDPSMCETPMVKKISPHLGIEIDKHTKKVHITMEGKYRIEIHNLRGRTLEVLNGNGPKNYPLGKKLQPGIYFIKVYWNGNKTVHRLMNF